MERKMEKMNSKKVGKVIGAALAVFLLAMVMQPVMAGVSAEITGVELNGQGNFIEVSPGELIEVEVSFKWMNVWSRQENLDEIVVGFEGTPIFCVVDTIINNVPEYDSGNINHAIKAFEITAPTEPGGYCIFMTTAKGTCEEAKLLYQNGLGLQMIADFDVIGIEPDEPDEPDDPNEWESEYVGYFVLDRIFPFPDVKYKIVIWKRLNELRVEITVPDGDGFQSGSVSISVDEDIFVYYHRGNVSICFEEGYGYAELIPKPENAFAEKTALLLAGFIPGASTVIYAEEIMDTTVFNYEEIDPDDIVATPLSDYFDSFRYTNTRDIAVIPWNTKSVDFVGIHSIRVNCPLLEFPGPGTYDTIFRIDFSLCDHRLRHDIALPIEIGKQRMEA